MKKVIIRVILLLALVGAVYGSYRYFQQMPGNSQTIATTKVKQGDVVVRAFTRGELRAVRSVTLTAPNLFGTVQVTQLAPLGALAREKDLIVEFDDSERKQALEETLLEVEQIDEQTKKAQADLSMRNNQDQVELLRAKYSVRRAELEVQRNELLSSIDQKKNQLNLEEARKRLSQLESDIQSRKAQAQAELAVLRERRNKSMLDVGRERQRIAQCRVLSPITGLISIRQNRGGFMGSFGQQVPDIREGDTIQPGTQVADVLDLSELEVIAKVGELDRANLREGQDVLLRLDAVPEKTFHGKIKNMSGTATSNPFGGDPGKKFDVVFSIDMAELLKGLGAKPDQIQRIMATAAANAKKAPASGMPMGGGDMMAMGGGAPGGAPGGMAMGGGAPGGAPGGDPGGAPGGARGGFGGGGAPDFKQILGMMAGNLPPAGKTELNKLLGKKTIDKLTSEEARDIMRKLREAMQAQGVQMGGGGRRGGGQESASTDPPKPTKEDLERENAKLPAPPEESNQLDVLLRPGLLADVEIIIEKVSNAINIPAQAVFEKDGKSFVYVLKGTKFEQRTVKPLKRSESTMIIAEGLNAGEAVAMADPNAKPDDAKKKKDKNGKGGGSMQGMPGGKT